MTSVSSSHACTVMYGYSGCMANHVATQFIADYHWLTTSQHAVHSTANK